MRVLHIPCTSDADPLPVLEQHYPEIERFTSFGIVATAQHLGALDGVCGFLQSRGKKVAVGGQVLGCSQDNALGLDAECIIYVGSGRFHPLGIAVKTSKPVYMLNPLSGVLDEITEKERDRYLMKRKAALKRALSSDTFGILVCTKRGQFEPERALKVKASLSERGKSAYLFAGDELTPPNLLPFKVDVWVNTACPRMEADEYNRPIVNDKELDEFIGYL